MTPNFTDSPFDDTEIQVDDSLRGVAPGAVLLIAGSGTIRKTILGLWFLEQYRNEPDYTVAVTTDLSAKVFADKYSTHITDDNLSRLGIIDTTSKRESLTMVYQVTPTIYTPRHGDVTRTMLALSELDTVLSTSNSQRHLLISSLTAILDDTPLDQARRFITSITRSVENPGYSLLEIDFTTHNTETLSALQAIADGIIWVEQRTDGTLAMEYNRF